MANRRDNLDEFFDNLFAQLDNDDDNVVNITISDFGKVIKNEVDNSAKRNGYDTLEDMIAHKVSGRTYVPAPSAIAITAQESAMEMVLEQQMPRVTSRSCGMASY